MTAADKYCLVALGKRSPQVGSIGGPLDRSLTIRSPDIGLGPFFAILAKLQQEGNNIKAADGYWLVALDISSSRVGSIRRPLGRGLTIWISDIGLGPFFAILAIKLRSSFTN